MKTILLSLLFVLVSLSAPAQKSADRALPPIHPQAQETFSAILMWHDVVEWKKDVWFDTTTTELKKQFQEIKRRKFTVIPLERLYRHLQSGEPLPPRPLVLTFDDNNLGLYRYAFPLLKQYNYPATFFVHTDYVGVRTDKDHSTWDQLREMQASGLVSIQGHSRSHPADMRKTSDIGLQKELAGSKAKMEREMGKPVFAFAYTEGHFDRRVAEAVARYGYKIAITEDRGNAATSPNLMMVHRYSMHRRAEQALNDVERAWHGK
jgi:peptidoglycan/xylan/chitin deacetylase (PgdA/CDA1 family)